MLSRAQAIRRSQVGLSDMARDGPFLWRRAQLARFALMAMPRKVRPIEAWRKKLAAFRAVDVAQQRRRVRRRVRHKRSCPLSARSRAGSTSARTRPDAE